MRYLAAELFKPARREEAWQRNVSVFLNVVRSRLSRSE